MQEFTLDVHIISRCTHNHYARELKKLGITMGQFPFIMGIVEHDGISQEKLSEKIMISKSTTAAIIQQLLNAGLITREVDKKDRRNFCLHATQKALLLAPKIKETIEKCHTSIMAELTDIEKDVLVNLMRKVRNRAEIALQRPSFSSTKRLRASYTNPDDSPPSQ